MTVTLADLSNNNSPAAADVVADPSIAGVYAKATEALTFIDKDYPVFRQATAKARKPFGGYLFLHPDLDGEKQALFFLRHATPRIGDLEPAVDSETLTAGNYQQAAAATLATLTVLKQHGYDPILYGSTSFLEQLYSREPGLKKFRVWQAQYASVLQRIPGVRALLWQFTDRMVVGKGRFRVDGDRLLARSLTALEIRGPVHPPAPAKKPRPRKPVKKPAAAGKTETKQPPVAGEPKNDKPFTRPSR